jgi:hypothetical protein
MHQNMKEGAIVQCVVCERYTNSRLTFSCRQCKKSPLCLDHLERKYSVCTWCAADKEIQIYKSLRTQERSINAFLKLSQFIFILVSILFITKKFFFDIIPVYFKDTIFLEYLLPFGGFSVAAITFSCIVLFSQRKQIREIEAKLKVHKNLSKTHLY